MILIGIIVVIVVGLLSVRSSREHILGGIGGCFGLFAGCGCLFIIISVFFGPAVYGFGTRIFSWIIPRVVKFYCLNISGDKCDNTVGSINLILKIFN